MRGTIRTLCVDVFILSLSCSGLWAQQQTVAPTPTSQTTDPGTAVSFNAIYDTSNGDATVTGLGLRMHFDSSALTFNSLTAVLGTSLVAQQAPQADGTDFDEDASTDQFVLISWADIAGMWPGAGTLPATLFTANFTTDAGFSSATKVNFTASSMAAGFTFSGTSALLKYLPRFGERVQYFSQFAIGGGAATDFTIHNPGSEAISVVVNLLFETTLAEGEVAPKDLGQSCEETVQVAAGANRTMTFDGSAGGSCPTQSSPAAGWAELTSENNFESTLFFRIAGVGNVGVLPSEQAQQMKVFNVSEEGRLTGFAMANQDAVRSADVTFKIFGSDGQLQKEGNVGTLAPGEHLAKFFNEEPFSAVGSGTVELSSNRPVIAMALRLDPVNSGFLLSSVPVIRPRTCCR